MPQAGVGQIETVHQLIVIVPRRRMGVAGKSVGIGSLKIDDPAALLVEKGKLGRIIKGIIRVGGNLTRMAPWTSGLIGARKPDFTQQGRSTKLAANHNPFMEIVIPIKGTARPVQGFPGIGVNNLEMSLGGFNQTGGYQFPLLEFIDWIRITFPAPDRRTVAGPFHL